MKYIWCFIMLTLPLWYAFIAGVLAMIIEKIKK